MTNETLSKIIAFLSLDQFRHLVHLKYLRLYADTMQYHYFEENNQVGVLLRYPTRAVSWDTSYYPQTDDVLLPVASNYTTARLLAQYALETIPTISPLVIKFCEPETRAAFSELFTLEPARVFVSYSTKQPISTLSDADVVVSQRLDEVCGALYLQNGYSQTELNNHFSDGALSFTIYQSHQPVCTCFVFRNFGSVWEIGGVHTIEQARRKGYARQVVQKAVNTLLKMDLIPRYQVDVTNRPSIQLAESIGLVVYLRLEHYLAMPKN